MGSVLFAMSDLFYIAQSIYVTYMISCYGNFSKTVGNITREHPGYINLGDALLISSYNNLQKRGKILFRMYL